MEQYSLTAKEFIYLCLNAGAKKVYGVEDEFKKVSKDHLTTEFSNVQKELVQKRYMRIDFDGNVTVKKKVLDNIRICALCDRVVLFAASGDTGNKKRNYYFKGDEAVCLIGEAGTYLLERVEKETVTEAILKEMSQVKSTISKEKVSFTVKQREVQKVLREKNIRKYHYYSLVQVNKKEDKRVHSLFFVDTNKGLLSAKSKIVGLDNVMDMNSCSVSEMKNSVQELLK